MPSLIGHTAAAIAIGSAFQKENDGAAFWVLGIICSVLPDADVIGFRLGIKYGEMIGHRGLSHSILFACFTAAAVVLIFYRKSEQTRYLLYFFLAAASHGILDAFTNGGMGVAFWAPFSGTRYMFAGGHIQVSPLSIRHFFSSAGIRVLYSELKWIIIPGAVFFSAATLLKRYLKT